ncbi:MAG TPA: Wzz/FepE/Etk N-terminal domain-containing protein, partial [Blastocatellia bacterium]
MSDEKLDLQKLPDATPVEVLPKEGGNIRPHYPTGYGYGYGYGDDDQKKLLREMWRVMRKRKYLIASVALIVTTLVAIEMYRTKDTYKASVMVEVGREGTLLRGPDGLFADDYDPYYIINIRTKILSVKSRALLEQAVIDEKLYQNPKFLEGGGKKSVAEAISLIGARLGLVSAGADEDKNGPGAVQPVLFAGNPESRTAEEKQLLNHCVGTLQGGLAVDIVRDTRALSISFTHTDAETAATVANSVANTLLNRNFENKTQKFTSAARWLDESTRKLQAKVRDAEEALAAYTRDRGIFTTDDNNTLTTSKLVRLHEEALRAETDRVLKESLYQEVKQGRVAEIPEAYTGKYAPKVAELQKEMGQLEAQHAEMRVKFGPEHPRMIEIKE